MIPAGSPRIDVPDRTFGIPSLLGSSGVRVGATSAGPVGGEVLSALVVAVHTVAVQTMRQMIYGGAPRVNRLTGDEMVYNDVIEKTGMAIDAAGVAVIVAGAALAFVTCAVRLTRHEHDVYRPFRQRLGQTILLGLELLVAGDIIRTVAATPNLTSVAILASIVAIRTFLSFSLEVELSGRWPWQKRDSSAS